MEDIKKEQYNLYNLSKTDDKISFTLGEYISYSECYQKSGKKGHDFMDKIKKQVNDVLGKTKECYACYDCEPHGKKEPDLDNVLLYNLHIRTQYCNHIILERKRGESDPTYLYSKTIPENKRNFKEIVSFDFQLDSQNTTVKEIYKVYKAARKKFIEEFNKNKSLSQIDINKINERLALVIKYSGTKKLTESGLIKPLIDGIISAMHKPCKAPENFVLPDEYLEEEVDQQSGIGIMTCADGRKLFQKHGENGIQFNPNDHLLDYIEIIKQETTSNKTTATLYYIK